ncbi:LexA family transcriptional regulator [Pusillimonas noertemannii]|uniref:Phage repressor protein C with HTH and peptisase S24 domain n=1 Tax=Pusillimonas noertemannii TaxID=305977 RepID=A0A2U1CMG1_9BURK|nr:LexA family transcriptional regulator [Pusillimonas noertemannii]NYT68771.1 LexA family transcriptional regulator [Pusillimonas noertemannii]PVY62206.1 phage repressor protein C with HTH and peptisase S24 domain [Pusillimonas noertemannii]TFL10811.1 LexA family transcriptional regulator [Pusillimonas noertemannii]
MEISDWVRNAREFAGLTQPQLGDALGISKQNISAWERERHEPSFDNLIKIISVTGYPEPLPGLPLELWQARLDAEEAKQNEIYLPVRNAAFELGYGTDDPGIELVAERIRFTRSFIRSEMPHITSLANLSLLPHADSSMEPTFSAGNLLVVDRGVNDMKGNAVYAFRLQGQVFVKRIVRNPITMSITAKSDNELHGSFEIEPAQAESLEVLGMIVYAMRGKRVQ